MAEGAAGYVSPSRCRAAPVILMMMNVLKQARAAVSLLNPEEVSRRAQRPVHFGLVATSDTAYAEMEDFLAPSQGHLEDRTYLLDQVHRAGDAVVPDKVDLILFEQGVAAPPGTYTFNRNNPAATIGAILHGNDDLWLALARQYPAFRQPVVERTIQTIAQENALFAVATALPDVLPSLMELPWAFGEFASDTAFLTGNQVRMAFQIAAAYGREAGFVNQKGAILSIVAGAFGWRALARELVGKIPLGGGLIPKGAIAYAGTFVVGKSLEHYYRGNSGYTRAERRTVYREALEHGRKQIEARLQSEPRT
jgi:uncharacterized protein (DUF697 family)